MKRSRTAFETTHHAWLVSQLAQKQAAAMKASQAAKAADREVARRISKKNHLYMKARKAQREVAAVHDAINHFQAEQAEDPKVNVDAFQS